MPPPTTGDSAVSSQLRTRLSESGSLLGALDAITNWHAFLLLAATFLAAILTATVLGAITAALAQQSSSLAVMMGLITGLAVFIVHVVGVNAVGILLSDNVWERPQRSIGDALVASLFTSHRLILILFLEAVLFLIYAIILTVVLFICKAPGVGPLLYAFIFPASAILTGAIVFALVYVAIPLAAPAVWNGSTVMQAIAMLKEVARRKLLFVVIMFLLLGFLLVVATGIIWLIVASGTSIVLSLSSVVVGMSAGGLGNPMGMIGPIFGSGFDGASGYSLALGFGFAVLFLLGITPGFLVGMRGAAVIYRAAISDLSLAEAEAQMSQRFDEIKQRTQEAKQRATMPHPTTPAAMQPTPAAQPTCPSCGSVVIPDDVFCGNCGHQMK